MIENDYRKGERWTSSRVLAAVAGATTVVVAVGGLLANGGLGGLVFGAVLALTGLVIAGLARVFSIATAGDGERLQSEADAVIDQAYREAGIALAEADLRAASVVAEAEHQAEVTVNEARGDAADVRRAAEADAHDLVAAARADAESIREDARRRADRILMNAQETAARLQAEAQTHSETQLKETQTKIAGLVADAERKHSEIVSASSQDRSTEGGVATKPFGVRVKQYSISPDATPEEQVALLTKRIADLTERLKANKHDNHSRRGLLLLVGRRRRLLNYVRQVDNDRYRALIKRLDLRR